MNELFPIRLTQAREFAGFTKTEIAQRLSVSPAAVAQWETGVKNPTFENLSGIARETGVPVSLFFKPLPFQIESPGPVTFRSWKDATTRAANRRAKRLAQYVSEAVVWLDSVVSLPPTTLPEPSRIDGLSPALAATECRRFFGLGDLPLLKLGELLEAIGISVCKTSLLGPRTDAFSCVIQGHPFIFLGDLKRDRARSRFDAAHELGHLVLHQHLSEGELQDPSLSNLVEAQANEFAAAFLMPSKVFERDVTTQTLRSFLSLKPKWGTSVQAMVEWSAQLGLIDSDHRTRLYKQMTAKGWRKPQGEPLDDLVPSLTAGVAKRCFDLLVREKVVDSASLFSILSLPSNVICELFEVTPEILDPTPSDEKIIPFSIELDRQVSLNL